MQKSGKSVDSCHLAIVKLCKTTIFNRMLNMAAKKDTREKKDSLGIFFLNGRLVFLGSISPSAQRHFRVFFILIVCL
jgi:hypothetical protein